MAFTKTFGVDVASAGKTASVDIPKPRNFDPFASRDSFPVTGPGSMPVGKHPHMLPTPPNSISPVLLPHCFRSRDQAGNDGPTSLLPSELDLRDSDCGTKDQAHDLPSPSHLAWKAHESGSPDFGAAGVITPSLLAKHHLPDILLVHGPLAIRHVMGHLTTSVPGFSRIPAPKARRLVVAALEGRGEVGQGGLNGDVLFEKVGWGRWDARLRGQPPREQQSSQESPSFGASYSPPPSLPSSHSNYLGPEERFSGDGKRWARASKPGNSWTDDSVVFSHDEDMEMMHRDDESMLYHDADAMSLDNNNERSCSSSEAPPEGPPSDEEVDDLTDDEDWANIGAAALRQASLSGKRRGQRYLSSFGNPRKRLRPVPSVFPMPPAGAVHVPHESNERVNESYGTGVDIGSNSQEREAIEALVRLSSV